MSGPVIACVPCVRGVGGSSDLNALVHACTRLTPRIERHPDALVLDLAGCERLILARCTSQPVAEDLLVGAVWPRLAAAVHRRLCASSADSAASATSPDAVSCLRLALASTCTAAWLAAHPATVPALPSPSGGTSWQVLVPDQVTAFLRPLPVGVLASLPDLRGASGVAEALAALAQSGIGTLGQLARVRATALRRRFGPLGSTLATLAAGQDAAPLRVWRPPAWIGARLGLDPPIEAAQLVPALTPLAQHLAARLGQQHQVVSALALVLQTESSATVRATHRLSRSIASADALLNQAERLLAGLADRKPKAIYEGIHLRVGDPRPASARQETLWRSQEERGRRTARKPQGTLAQQTFSTKFCPNKNATSR